jgi:poly(3-hydroxyalkanoate) synthetase
VKGVAVDPARLAMPVFEAGATRDRIVPPDARPIVAGALRVEVEAGHVGMIVGRARHRLWEPLSNFLGGD